MQEKADIIILVEKAHFCCGWLNHLMENMIFTMK